MSGFAEVSVPVLSLFGPPPEGTVYCPGSHTEGDIAAIAKSFDEARGSECRVCYRSNDCRHAKHLAAH